MTVEIKNAALNVGIDTLGAQLMSIRSADGTEYLWQGNPEYWSDRALNLFPYIGRLTDGKCRVHGKEYPMVIHGFAKSSVFDVLEQSSDAVTMELRSSPETLSCYPYEFSFRIRYALEGSTLSVCFAVENRSEEQMPFAVGGHPGFNVPLCEGERFEDYSLVFSEPCEPERIGFTPEVYLNGINEAFPLEDGCRLRLRHGLFDDDAIILSNMCTSVTLSGPSGRGVSVSYPDMRYLGFWHWPHKDAPYVCIEPWSSLPSRAGTVEELTSKSDLLRLKPGGVYENCWTISVF